MHPQFLRQRHNVVALLQAGDGVLLERLWKFAHTFLGHLPPPLGVKCANSPCLNLGVQSTKSLSHLSTARVVPDCASSRNDNQSADYFWRLK